MPENVNHADQQYLLNQQYKTADNLQTRMGLHARFSTAKIPWQRWVFEQLLALKPQCILEIGCGPARLWLENNERIPAEWQVSVGDLSPGMVEEARRNIPASFDCRVIDAQALPFDEGAFDVVIANHMLYHVPDRTRALAEIRRVLKPGGYLVAATNGARHMAELFNLLSVYVPGYQQTAFSFTLENGREQLTPWFAEVSLVRPPESGLAVTELEPLVAYAASTAAFKQEGLLVDQETAIRSLTETVRQEIATKGVFYISQDSGLFIARKAAN